MQQDAQIEPLAAVVAEEARGVHPAACGAAPRWGAAGSVARPRGTLLELDDVAVADGLAKDVHAEQQVAEGVELQASVQRGCT